MHQKCAARESMPQESKLGLPYRLLMKMNLCKADADLSHYCVWVYRVLCTFKGMFRLSVA